MIIIFLIVSAVSAFIALKLPPVYESTARLLMESPQIPDALAAPTVDTAALEQLQVIEQRLMTRSNLLDIARKFNVFPAMATMTPDDIVSAMRDTTTIAKQAGREQATLLTITFDASDAQTAANVVNEYVTRILTDNTASRTSQAQDTLEFFQQEVERLSADLSTQSAKVLDFQNRNSDALPGTLNYRLTEQSNLQERLASVARQISGLKDQKQRLIEIYRATGQLDNSRAVVQSPESVQLAQLQVDLDQALAVYAPTNPKVTLLQTRIAKLQAKVGIDAARDPAPVPDTPPGTGIGVQTAPADGISSPTLDSSPMSMLDIQTTEIDSQITQLTEESNDTTKQLAALKDSIDRSSGVAVQLEALNRDYANIQAQYDSATDRLSKASTGERIAVLSKGQRIGVLDAATVPDVPARPHRQKIIAMGTALGLALGLGLVALLELLNTSVRRPIDLEHRLNITPIGTIPYSRTPGEMMRRRLAILFAFLVIAAGLPARAWVIDTYYMPIDLILAKVSTKLGL
ncbi:MAG: lipopolysaccharide biosynthesis [Pseudorhodobacter sp.]|nr:lipopolysaccharide biosynthesis [Pseudorhodobacter sp.]